MKMFPLKQDVNDYMEKEVHPYNPGAWFDPTKIKIGYEIQFTKTFYEFQPLEPSQVIAKRIEEHENSLMKKLKEIFG